ncbi:MAG: Gfo/Idh/MocA family oxidoreductase [Verrucomicrobiota bacterium]
MSGADLNYLPVLPQNKDVRIGCVGCGFIMADCHLVAYRNAGFNPVAIASRTTEKAQAVADRHEIPTCYDTVNELLDDASIEVVDVAVPPAQQIGVIEEIVKRPHIKGVLAQKPLGVDYAEAVRAQKLCQDSGKLLVVNQNMRYDHSIRACRDLLERKVLGDPVLGTIDMRAIPHWMPWQEDLGWVTLRIMSIHHLDTFRFLFGDPVRVFASVREDPRTAKKFAHEDGICLYILEYENGLRATSVDDVWAGPAEEGSARDIGIGWRVEGTEGMARGTIGWPSYPERTPSTIDYTTTASDQWVEPRWDKVWFPDAFVGPMAELLRWLESGVPANLNGEDNLKTMALVEACYLSAREHRVVELCEIA